MRPRLVLMMGAVLLVLAATPASAQWFISPHVGGNFGGDTDDSKFSVGSGFGFLGGEVFGFEVDFGYSPDFFDTDDDIDFDNANLATVMVNLMASTPRETVFRPYGSGGIGWMRTHLIDAGDLFSTTNDDFGVNIGGGLIGQFNEHVGWRTDIRYFRALEDNEKDNEFDAAFGDFDLWRGTFGVMFSF